MAQSTLRVEVLGTSFLISSEESQEYIGRVAEYLEGQIAKVQNKVPMADPLKISLLVSLNIIDQLFKEKERSTRIPQDEYEELERMTKHLIDRIDESLMEN